MKRAELGAAFLAVATIIAGVIPATTGVAYAATTPTVTVGDLQVVETDIGTGVVTIPVTLSSPATAAVNVKLKITGGTATKKKDYSGTISPANFSKGQVATVARLDLIGDGVVEPTETISFQTTSVTGATVADGSGVVTITDNDANGVSATPEIRVGRPTVWEGNVGTRSVQVPVTLSRPSPTPVTIGFVDGCRGQFAGFAAGAVATTVTVAVIGDVVDTPDRVIKNAVGLWSGTATVPVAAGDTAVLDDDGPPAGIPVGGVARVAVPASGAQPTYPSLKPNDPDWTFPESSYASISANGRYVAFQSDASDLVDCDTNKLVDVFVKDLATGAIERVSVASNGAQSDRESTEPMISPDGRYVLFISRSTALGPPSGTGRDQLFIHDRTLNTTQLVAHVALPSFGQLIGSISADDRYVVFSSLDPLAGDTDQCVPGQEPDNDGQCTAYDAFVLDRATNSISLVSGGQNGSPTRADLTSPTISPDGSTIVFSSGLDVWAVDRASGATERVSVDGAGQPIGLRTWLVPTSVSGNGRKVAWSTVCNHESGCPNSSEFRAYVRDRDAGTTTELTVGPGGVPKRGVAVGGLALSADGRYVTFDHSENFATVPSGCAYPTVGPDAGSTRTYQRDLVTGAVVVVNRSAAGVCGDGSSQNVGSYLMSADGRYVVFATDASNLVAGDTNGVWEIYVKRLR